MSTEPISRERLEELIKDHILSCQLYCAMNGVAISELPPERIDIGFVLRDYARLREENVEADARLLRYLQSELDRAPADTVFSLYEYGTRVFALRNALEKREAIRAASQPRTHSGGCGIYGGDAYKRGPNVCTCGFDAVLQGPRHE